MIRLILVALDGSPVAEQALPPAGRFAAQTGATLLIVHVAQGDPARAEAGAYLSAVQRRLAPVGCRVRGILAGGEPAQAILGAARLERAELIAMVTQDYPGGRRLVPGSVANTVLRHATVPVLLVPASEHQAPMPAGTGFRRILVPLDGSADAERALAFVVREGIGTASGMALLRAVPAPAAPRMPEGLQLSAWELRERAGWEAEHALLAARDYLERLAYTFVPHTIPHFCVPRAYPAKAILDVAAGWSIDLIAMTARDAGHGRYIHGGVAAHVLQHTEVPVLCLPGGDASAQTYEIEVAGNGMAQRELALAGAR